MYRPDSRTRRMVASTSTRRSVYPYPGAACGIGSSIIREVRSVEGESARKTLVETYLARPTECRMDRRPVAVVVTDVDPLVLSWKLPVLVGPSTVHANDKIAK